MTIVVLVAAEHRHRGRGPPAYELLEWTYKLEVSIKLKSVAIHSHLAIIPAARMLSPHTSMIRIIVHFMTIVGLQLATAEPILLSKAKPDTIETRQSTSLKTLEQWQRANCQGVGRVCFDMPQLSCCENPQQFSSGRCRECGSNQLMALFRLGRGVCDAPVAATNGNSCITFRNLRGSEWCEDCRPNKRDAEAETGVLYEDELGWWQPPQAARDGVPCQKANIITIDGSRWFKVNYDVPEEHTAMLEAWWAKEGARYDELSDELLQYEVAYDPSEQPGEQGYPGY